MNAGRQASAVQVQYETWPYPRVPLLASVPSTHPWQLHCEWLWDRCGSGAAPRHPRIWIAGCGTFQPYVFAVANPQADITATDISAPSLDLARSAAWRVPEARRRLVAGIVRQDPRRGLGRHGAGGTNEAASPAIWISY
jgi:hypothetical protein